MRKIEVCITPGGDVSIDLSGFRGKGCDKVAADLAGGDKPRLVRHKPEYHEAVKQTEVQRG